MSAGSGDFIVFDGMTAPNAVVLILLCHHNYTEKGAAMKKNIAFPLSIQKEIEKRHLNMESGSSGR